VNRVEELKESIPRMKSDIANKTAEVDKMVKEERNLSMQCNKLRTEVRTG